MGFRAPKPDGSQPPAVPAEGDLTSSLAPTCIHLHACAHTDTNRHTYTKQNFKNDSGNENFKRYLIFIISCFLSGNAIFLEEQRW